jgi:hypothetical protein
MSARPAAAPTKLVSAEARIANAITLKTPSTRRQAY